MKWWEMLVLLISIVGSAVGVAWLLKGEISDIEISIVKVQSVHDLDMASIRSRLTSGGWSRPEQQQWIDALRTRAGHSIPNLDFK